MLTRRNLLKTTAFSSLASLIPLGILRRPVSVRADASSSEIYAGFLLLPEGAPPPDVRPPRYGIPIVCGVGGNQFSTAAGAQAASVSRTFATHAEVFKFAGIPLYTLNNPPPKLRPAGGAVLGYEWGTVATATLDFQSYDAQEGVWISGVSLWAETQFPRPFPFWYPVSGGDDATGWPEKVDFLPAPGLRVASGVGPSGKRLGYSFYWIARDVLYWLIVEDYSSQDEAQALASALVPMN